MTASHATRASDLVRSDPGSRFARRWDALRLRLDPLPIWTGPPHAASWPHLAGIFLLAVAARLAFLWHHGALLLPDSTGRYLPVSDALFATWTGTVYDTPGYPVFIATIAAVFGAGKALFIAQALLDGITVLLIHGIGRQLGLKRGAVILALYFALHAGAILFANTVLSESLFTFLTVLACWLFCRADARTRWPYFLAIGLTLGLAAITRANGVLMLAVFVAVTPLCRLERSSLRHALALLLAAALPIGIWVQFNARHNGVRAIAQGGGWQWLQNIAFFELLDPATLPPGEAAHYRNWKSLGEMRRRLSEDPSVKPAATDAIFRRIARENAAARPGAYLARLPAAFLLPRAFIKNVTRAAVRPEEWAEHASRAANDGYPGYARTIEGGTVFHGLYYWLRKLTVFESKYALLMLTLIPALFYAWRRRNGRLLLLLGLPFSQFLVLWALLNPIERYYFPFEAMMILGLVVTLSLTRRRLAKKPRPVPQNEG